MFKSVYAVTNATNGDQPRPTNDKDDDMSDDGIEAQSVQLVLRPLKTPEYYVFRDSPPDTVPGCLSIRNVGGWSTPFYRFVGRGDDPWANYK